MQALDQQKLKRNTKLQNKNSGLSTRNFVATELQQKKWLKVKQCHIHNRQLQEAYYYNAILNPTIRRQQSQSLLSLKDISIYAMLKKVQEREEMVFYLQRPFVSMSLTEMLTHNYNGSEQLLSTLLSQLFQLFIQTAQYQLPLTIPTNFLLAKKWNKKISMSFNYTSLVGFQFFSQRTDIYSEKFRQIVAYLHPQILKQQAQSKQYRLNVCFRTKIYSFALIILSIILKKPLSLQFYLKPSQNTLNVNEVKPILESGLKKIQDILAESSIEYIINKRLKNFQHRAKLKKFMKKVIDDSVSKSQSNMAFRSWKDVIDYFNPNLLSNYISSLESQSKQYVYVMKELFRKQTEESIKFYKKMGIIDPNLSKIDDVRELAIYFMLKVDGLAYIKNIFETKAKVDHYSSHKYIQLKRLLFECKVQKQQIQKIQQKPNIIQDKPSKEEEQQVSKNDKVQSLCLNFKDEINQSLNYNLFTFQQEEDKASMSQKSIYVPNEMMKTLDIYGSMIWL